MRYVRLRDQIREGPQPGQYGGVGRLIDWWAVKESNASLPDLRVLCPNGHCVSLCAGKLEVE